MSDTTWIDLTDAGTDAGTEGRPATKPVKKILGSNDTRVVQITYKLSGFFVQYGPLGQEDFVRLDIPDAGFTSEVGSPMLAREGLFVAIPSGTKFENLTLDSVKKEALPQKFNLLSVPKDMPEGKELKFLPSDKIFSSDALYPDSPVEYVGTQKVMELNCVHLYVHPFQYRPKNKEVMVLTEIVISLHFSGSGLDFSENPEKIRDSRFSNEVLGYDEELNKDAIDSGEAESKKRFLIITTTELLPGLQFYVSIKQSLFDVKVALKEDIRKLYPDQTVQEAIHSYIMAEDAKSQISYLLLGGDVKHIPTRMLDDGPDNTVIANDNYFCSDGDQNHPYPMFSLGRFPASTMQEMKDMADVASYYNLFYSDIRKTTIFAAQQGSFYVSCTNNIVENMPSDFTTKKLIGDESSKAELKTEIEKGAGFINYRGHGSNDSWCSRHGLTIEDVETLDVGRNTPHVFSIACSNNGIHEENCFGISWIKNAQAISFLGASAPSYTLVNDLFNKFLWEEIVKKECTTIGDIFFKATRKLFQNTQQSRERTNTNILEYLLLGDPTSDYMDEIPYKFKIKGINLNN